jgi:hypothetical protein
VEESYMLWNGKKNFYFNNLARMSFANAIKMMCVNDGKASILPPLNERLTRSI